jgi:hypothetical protein
MSSALINRMIHVHLKVSHRDWLEWAGSSNIHPFVMQYIQNRPDHLWVQPPRHEETFSSPRSWHMLSDALNEYGARLTDEVLQVLAFGCLSSEHAGQFKAFVKQICSKYKLKAIFEGDTNWPAEPQDRDILYFLAQSFRAYLTRELPSDGSGLNAAQKELAHRGKALLKELASISLEMAQMVVSEEGAEALPNWLLIEIVRDLPRLVVKKEN